MKKTAFLLTALLAFTTAKLVAQPYNARIIDGKATSSAEFPSFVSLLSDKGECGGTLIDKQWVMTAAHCLTDDYDQQNVLPSNLFVQTNPKPFDNVAAISPDNLFIASEIIIHPNYAFPQNDIALVKLSRSADNITPIILNDNSAGLIGKTGTIVGYGSTTRQKAYETVTDVTPQLAQKAEVPIISDSYCTGTLICAGENYGLNSPDACRGDSGGPLYVTRNGIRTQAGIISSGYGCGVGHTSAYTDVSQFKSFISRNTNAKFLSGTPLKNVTGVWFDPSKNGMGFTFVQSENILTGIYYGYRDSGVPFWLVSDVINTPPSKGQATTVVLRVARPNTGATFTQAPQTVDSGTEYWGTASITFNSCNSATARLSGKDGTVTFNLVKLQTPKEVSCN